MKIMLKVLTFLFNLSSKATAFPSNIFENYYLNKFFRGVTNKLGVSLVEATSLLLGSLVFVTEKIHVIKNWGDGR